MSKPSDNPSTATRARLRRLAWLLDSSIELPGGFRIGLDGIIGLLPGIGDVIAAALSSYIIAEAARMNVPGSVLARMVMNVLAELVVGTVPVLGDLFDFVFKANERNVRLIEAHVEQPRRTRTRSRWLIAAIVAVMLLALLLALAIVVNLLGLAWSLLGG